MTEPLCTVVLSSFNRPVLIRDALDSVIQQTWPCIQLLIADDYSHGQVMSVFDEYTDRIFKRTRGSMIVPPKYEPTNEERQYGQRCAVCINEAMKYANGEFVCFLPDDDWLDAKSIEVRVRYLMEHPEVNAVYGRLSACKSVRPVAGIHYEATADCVHDATCFWQAEPLAQAENRLDHSMPLFRRVDDLPQWPVRPWPQLREAIRDAQDWGLAIHDCPDSNFFLACRIAGIGPFHSIPDVVTHKRYHSYHHRTDPNRRE